MDRVDLISRSVEETVDAGFSFGARLGPGQVVALLGDLGAGKTHFVKGVAKAHGIEANSVSSPTFAIANEYRSGRCPIYHIDCYRLSGARELERTGADEYIGGDGICLVEWPQRIEELLPPDTILVSIRHGEEGTRHIQILPPASHE